MSREYLVAGRALNAVEAGQTFKAYCSKTRLGTTDFLLASETIKFRTVISDLLDKAALSARSLDIGSKGVLMVMVYELLFGKGKIKGGGKVKRKLIDVLHTLQMVLQNEMRSRGVVEPRELLPEHIRIADSTLRQYLRVNTLKPDTTVLAAILSKCPEAEKDEHVPNLFVLPNKSPSFGEHPLVKAGKIIIQDKASCLPSQLLMDEWSDGDALDACAAPGNKTSHLAALMAQQNPHKTAKIFAFDKDSRRAALLQERMSLAGASENVKVANLDFLQIDISSYNSVTAILLDPSCSGSGVVRSLDRLADNKSGSERLEALRTFQVQALKKAMTFLNVRHIAYSTCSVHLEENESVVAEVLRHGARAGWRLKAPERLKKWERRGLPFSGLTQAQSACLVRCSVEDGMIGFFVAIFERAASRGAKRTHTKDEVGNTRQRPLKKARRGLWRPFRYFQGL